MTKLAERISKLERSRCNGYVAYRFLEFNPDMTIADYERLRELTLNEMVSAGEIGEHQRDQVFFRSMAHNGGMA
jgi:hypothetical protein